MKKLVVLALVLGAAAVFGVSQFGHVDSAGMVAGIVTAWAG